MIEWGALLDVSNTCIASLTPPSSEPERQFNEALARTSINRSYYAAFTAACIFAKTAGYSKNYKFSKKVKGGEHEKLWAWYEENGRPEIADMGSSLKRRRHHADYKLQQTANHLPDPQIALQEAGWLCDQLFPPAQPAQPTLSGLINP